mgnify:CR=1 FL=1
MLKAKGNERCPYCGADLNNYGEMLNDSHRHYDADGKVSYEAFVQDGLLYVKEIK